MNKTICSLLTLALFLAPTLVFASCSATGATIAYVNGIETTAQQADADLALLKRIFFEHGGSTTVQFIVGYNPMHLDGLGDDIESISQAFNAPISDFDLDTILTQIASEVTTQKLVLVGHSQGSFYTNEIYDYLVKNGAPAASLAVYNLASPAGFVAGGGNYLTSTNDKAINLVRQLDAAWGVSQALPANITIPPESDYAENMWGGHEPSVYFDGASQRIASDISKALAGLSAGVAMSGPCFVPPALGLSYDAQKVMFGVADSGVANMEYAAADTRNTLVSVAENTNDILKTALSDAIFSVIPRPTAQNAAGAFAVEKALYGSSLSVTDYEALLSGQDIPQTEPSNPYVDESQIASVPVKPTPVVTSVQSVPPQTSPAEPGPPTAIPSIPIPTPVAIATSPGFGGGAAVPAIDVPVAADPDPEASSSPPIPASDPVSTTTDEETADAAMSSSATSSLQVSTPPADDAESTSTASATSTDLAPGASSASPVTDNFDAGFTGWNSYSADWRISSWSTTTSDCYSGSCLSESDFNQQYENIRSGTALNEGAFVIYFRNDHYLGQFGAGVCTEATSSECENASSIGGKDALIFSILNNYNGDAWHYLYFTFRDGAADKEYCGLVDVDDPAQCNWQDSSVPNGTMYSGVLFFTENGLNNGSSFYWDELGDASG